MNTFIITCLIITLSTVTSGAKAASDDSLISHERRLFHGLLDDLEKSIRPVKKHTDAVPLEFGLNVLRINELDEQTQRLATNVFLRMKWTDTQLTWNPSDYDGIKTMRIPASRIWRPDIVLYNTAHREDMLPNYEWMQAVVDYNGTVLYIPSYMVISTCLLDLSKFPYDEQVCELKFGSWVYDGTMVNMTHFDGQETIDMSMYSRHGVWELKDHKAKLNNMKYDCCAETYQDMTYTLVLKRRSNYYSHLFVIPSVILCFVTPTMFWLPPDGSEKMSLGTGVLLSHVLLLVMLESYIPAAHPVVPMTGMYYTFGLVMAALGLILSVIVRNVWSQGNRRKSLPNAVRTVVLGLLGRLLCVRREPYMAVQELQDMDGDVDDRTAASKVASVNARSEWRQLAVILDRLFFVLFFVITIIMTIAIYT